MKMVSFSAHKGEIGTFSAFFRQGSHFFGSIVLVGLFVTLLLPLSLTAGSVDDLTSEMLIKNPGILMTLEDTLKAHYRNAQIILNQYNDAQYGNRYVLRGVIQGTDRYAMTIRGIAVSVDGDELKPGVVREESILRITDPDVSGEPGSVFRGGEYRFIQKRNKKNSYGIMVPEYTYGKLSPIPLSLIQKKADQVRFWDQHAERYLHAIELLIRNSVSNGDYEDAKNYYFDAINKNLCSTNVIKSWQFRVEGLLRLNDDERAVLKTGFDLAEHFIDDAAWNTIQVDRDTIQARYDAAIYDLVRAAQYIGDNAKLKEKYQQQAEIIAGWLTYQAEIYYDHYHDIYQSYYYLTRALELKPKDEETLKHVDRIRGIIVEELLNVAKEKIKDKEEWGRVEEEVNKVFVIDPENKKAKQYMKKIGRFKSE